MAFVRMGTLNNRTDFGNCTSASGVNNVGISKCHFYSYPTEYSQADQSQLLYNRSMVEHQPFVNGTKMDKCNGDENCTASDYGKSLWDSEELLTNENKQYFASSNMTQLNYSFGDKSLHPVRSSDPSTDSMELYSPDHSLPFASYPSGSLIEPPSDKAHPSCTHFSKQNSFLLDQLKSNPQGSDCQLAPPSFNEPLSFSSHTYFNKLLDSKVKDLNPPHHHHHHHHHHNHIQPVGDKPPTEFMQSSTCIKSIAGSTDRYLSNSNPNAFLFAPPHQFPNETTNQKAFFEPNLRPPELSHSNGFGQSNHHNFGYGLTTSRRKNATRESTTTLKVWLQEHIKNPYPTKGEKIMLAIITKMTLTQVSTWFANARRRLKKENKMTWPPKTNQNTTTSCLSSCNDHNHNITSDQTDKMANMTTDENGLDDDDLDDDDLDDDDEEEDDDDDNENGDREGEDFEVNDEQNVKLNDRKYLDALSHMYLPTNINHQQYINNSNRFDNQRSHLYHVTTIPCQSDVAVPIKKVKLDESITSYTSHSNYIDHVTPNLSSTQGTTTTTTTATTTTTVNSMFPFKHNFDAIYLTTRPSQLSTIISQANSELTPKNASFSSSNYHYLAHVNETEYHSHKLTNSIASASIIQVPFHSPVGFNQPHHGATYLPSTFSSTLSTASQQKCVNINDNYDKTLIGTTSNGAYDSNYVPFHASSSTSPPIVEFDSVAIP